MHPSLWSCCKVGKLATLATGMIVTLVPIATGRAETPQGTRNPVPVPSWSPGAIQWVDDQEFIRGPLSRVGRVACAEAPDRAAILRAMSPIPASVPGVYEQFRDDVDFSVERLVDSIEPPQFFPLIGPAQLHHCHFKCTIYYTATIRSEWPLPWECRERRSEVVYIDRDHLHMYEPTREEQQKMIEAFEGALQHLRNTSQEP